MRRKTVIAREVPGVGVFFFGEGQEREGGRDSLADYGRFVRVEGPARTAASCSAADLPAAARKTAEAPAESAGQDAPETTETPAREKRAATPAAAEVPAGRRQSGTGIRVVFPIGLKMAGMITLILFVSLGLVSALVWFFIHSSQERVAAENNLDVNNSASVTAETVLNSLSAAVSLLWHNTGPGDSRDRKIKLFFETHRDVAGLSFNSPGRESGNSLFVNESFFPDHEIDSSILARQALFPWNRAETGPPGRTELFNGTFFFRGVPVLVMRFPLPGNREDYATVYFSSGELADTFGTGANSSFLVNNAGDVLIHPDRDMMRNSVNLAYDPLVRS
ncbi:MAG: hypothetical protein LBP27_03935, partial [Treponema sp.]|nr:hypothetical protein [Treponema sp.]